MHPCDQANWRLKWHSQRSSALSSGGGGAGGLAAPANRASWRSTCRHATCCFRKCHRCSAQPTCSDNNEKIPALFSLSHKNTIILFGQHK